MTLQPGRMLAHYRLVETIGEGGMGVVWKAVDVTLDREVAVKVLPPSVAGNPTLLARLEREAKLLASLNHPHIAGIYGAHQVPSASSGQAEHRPDAERQPGLRRDRGLRRRRAARGAHSAPGPPGRRGHALHELQRRARVHALTLGDAEFLRLAATALVCQDGFLIGTEAFVDFAVGLAEGVLIHAVTPLS